jgi:hypothetical protein
MAAGPAWPARGLGGLAAAAGRWPEGAGASGMAGCGRRGGSGGHPAAGELLRRQVLRLRRPRGLARPGHVTARAR